MNNVKAEPECYWFIYAFEFFSGSIIPGTRYLVLRITERAFVCVKHHGSIFGIAEIYLVPGMPRL